MIKRTLYFENPAYLSVQNSQLIVKLPGVEKNLPKELRERFSNSIPIEDIAIVVLNNSQITITQGVLQALADNNCAIVVCDNKGIPASLQLPYRGNTLLGERYKQQIGASLPLQKQLWQQTVQAKIENQASILKSRLGIEVGNMNRWVTQVKSGDSTNLEGRAAVYYWANLFPKELHFVRSRDGLPPNNLLNFGYAILRSIIARALVGSGLLPTVGIFHSNKYNSFALADDIMEPYRPYVDNLVCEIINSGLDITEISTDIKRQLLTIPILDVKIANINRPLITAAKVTATSLQKCFAKEERRVVYPKFN